MTSSPSGPARVLLGPPCGTTALASRGTAAHALDVVDELIAVLDGLDAPREDLEPDADLEDGGDAEPSLAAPTGGPSQRVWAAGGSQDLERK